jgi:LPXTG-motif cell wall-anchored protein
MIPSSSIKASQDGKIENTIQIAIYNEGAFSIPGPSIVADPTADVLPSNGQIIKVNISEKVLSDSLALHPIKDIMVEEANLSDYLTYIYIFLAALILAGIGYYFYKRKKNTEETIVSKEPEIILSADEKAMAALTELKNKSLWQQGLIKEYQSSLTDIIRTYLKDRYGVDAMEMTTDEISHALTQTDFDKQYKDSLREILQVADLVKFAKATPSENIHQIFMDKAVDFVVNTKEVIKPKTSES